MRHSAAHPGFQAIARRIASRQGISSDRAAAELAAGTRRAGYKARKRNPRLNRVRG